MSMQWNLPGPKTHHNIPLFDVTCLLSEEARRLLGGLIGLSGTNTHHNTIVDPEIMQNW